MQLDIEVRLVFNTFKARVRSGCYEVAQKTELKFAIQKTILPAASYTMPDWLYSNYYYDTTKNSRNIHVFSVHV